LHGSDAMTPPSSTCCDRVKNLKIILRPIRNI
jgi:hypothetical protein